jgi:prophage DNA circulation protein
MSPAGHQGGCCYGHPPGHGHRRHVHLVGNTAMLVWKTRSALRLFADAMATTCTTISTTMRTIAQATIWRTTCTIASTIIYTITGTRT